MKRKSVFITDSNCITPLGFNVASNVSLLFNKTSGIKKIDSSEISPPYRYGSLIDTEKLNEAFAEVSGSGNYSRLEKMLILALAPLVKKQKPGERTAFFLSTTKGNIRSLENEGIPADNVFLQGLAKKVTGFFGFDSIEPIVISNACVSGTLAIAVAKRMIQAGAYDDAFIIAGDEFSEFILSGFNSFQALSVGPCRPYDKNRTGISIGEAAAAVYLTSEESKIEEGAFKVVGDGAINDANHISGPSRTGEGLVKSIQSALTEAGLSPEDIDFISAHGTATLYNDEMEAIAFNRLGLQDVPVNSLKGYYGHTMGASGLLEIVVSMEAARKNTLITSLGYSDEGVSKPINVITDTREERVDRFLKTSSGFGGSNTAVLFEKLN